MRVRVEKTKVVGGFIFPRPTWVAYSQHIVIACESWEHAMARAEWLTKQES